jgi:GNAT superfamily N-acetyltransferase
VAARIGSAGADSFIPGALRRGKFVGMAGFHRELEMKSRHKGRVWGVYVTEAARGFGIGRELMARLIERARGERGLVQIMLTVTTEQVAPRRLYESFGFVSFGREPRALQVDGRYLDEDYYVLRLA